MLIGVFLQDRINTAVQQLQDHIEDQIFVGFRQRGFSGAFLAQDLADIDDPFVFLGGEVSKDCAARKLQGVFDILMTVKKAFQQANVDQKSIVVQLHGMAGAGSQYGKGALLFFDDLIIDVFGGVSREIDLKFVIRVPVGGESACRSDPGHLRMNVDFKGHFRV